MKFEMMSGGFARKAVSLAPERVPMRGPASLELNRNELASKDLAAQLICSAQVGTTHPSRGCFALLQKWNAGVRDHDRNDSQAPDSRLFSLRKQVNRFLRWQETVKASNRLTTLEDHKNRPDYFECARCELVTICVSVDLILWTIGEHQHCARRH